MNTVNHQIYISGVNEESMPNVVGPGDGLGYYAHTLNPHLTCDSKKEADRASGIANIAYYEGYIKCQKDIRTALGFK